MCKFSYLLENYQPNSFDKLKILSYVITLAPITCIISVSIYIPLYVSLDGPDNFWVRYLHSLVNKSLSYCYNNEIDSNSICCDIPNPPVDPCQQRRPMPSKAGLNLLQASRSACKILISVTGSECTCRPLLDGLLGTRRLSAAGPLLKDSVGHGE